MTQPTAPVVQVIPKAEIRSRAAAFAVQWKDATSEAAERQLFWNAFFDIFGVPLRRVGAFEFLAKNRASGKRGYIDLLVPGELAIEHKSAGENLDSAMGQLVEYVANLDMADSPAMLVACDFKTFVWKNAETRAEGRFTLDELPDNIDLFWWLAGHVRRDEEYEDEEDANLVATEYMAKLHDKVLDSGYDPHALREWLTRILFCCFADDTAIWERRGFTHYLDMNTKSDGSDLGAAVQTIFQILNTPPDQRPKSLDEDLANFTYVGGDLFATQLPIPLCDADMRAALLAACRFSWASISPAIFGSMFQNVMTASERRSLGAHYTTEENILKTIRPLFLDELEAELDALPKTGSDASRRALDAFHDKLASLRFLDPACGCGNFLVVSYRELRRLEAEVLRRRINQSGKTGHQILDISQVFKVTVAQFSGIEIEEFPARIARTALYLMDHKANLEVSKEFGQYFARFPIPASPQIAIANALRADWSQFAVPGDDTIVVGNPPFVGSRMANDDQRSDTDLVWHDCKVRGKLDYVTNWYRVAAEYAEGTNTRVAFVSTNSISHGEQPAVLWPEMWKHGMHLDFAHRPFAWSSEAKGPAAVHVVIEGFSARPKQPPLPLWTYATVTSEPKLEHVERISPYLSDGPDVLVGSHQQPLVSGIPPMLFGSMARDGGFIANITPDEAAEIKRKDHIAAKYLRRLIGADEMLNGSERYCFWLVDADPQDLHSSPVLKERLAAVRANRLASPAKSTQAAATTPGLFVQRAQPDVGYLAVPRVSSSAREYLPTAFYGGDVIASDALLFVPGADMLLFGTMSSRVFTAWNRTVSGRLKSDLRVSQEITYNNFPWLDPAEDGHESIEDAAKQVLAARANHPGATLAALYSPLSMPEDLVAAHNELDRVTLGAYELSSSASEPDVLGELLQRYQALATS